MVRRARPSKGRVKSKSLHPSKKRNSGRKPDRTSKSANPARMRNKPEATGESTRRIASGKSRRVRIAWEFAPGLKSFYQRPAALTKVVRRLCENVAFTVAPKTISGEPIQAQRGRLDVRNIDDYRPRPDSVDEAVEWLRQRGFEIVRRGRFGITARGSAKLIVDVLKIKLVVHARPRRTTIRATRNFSVSYEPPGPEDLYVAPVESLTIKAAVSDHIDHFVFTPPPRYFAQPSPAEPDHTYFGIDKAAMRRLLNVPEGASGTGVRVAIIDTGFFRHPYYAANNLDYRPTGTPSAPNPEADPVGHGTAIAYNTFAIAPGVTVLGMKQTDPPESALEDAATAGADIISCAWGWDQEQSFPTLEAAIVDIIREGKIVLFASGDGAQSWPASMPQVLSVGGVYADQQNRLEASNLASGFVSSHYPGRNVPDICGLCGQTPKGIYIMMPCPPNSALDKFYAGKSYPNQDETRPDDGWFCASGTSSATPQIAGVVALMIEKARAAGRTLSTDSVRSLLQLTAVPIQSGNCAQGFPAQGHPNIAVGYGLVDAGAAIAAV